jgi:RHS repeat-associated protein
MLGTDDTAAENAGTSLLYAGEQYDSELSQYYLRARYYNPWSGTFNRMDPFAGNNQDPQSLHKYLYCHANPVNGIDPTGTSLLGTVVTATINFIQAHLWMIICFIAIVALTSIYIWGKYFRDRTPPGPQSLRDIDISEEELIDLIQGWQVAMDNLDEAMNWINPETNTVPTNEVEWDTALEAVGLYPQGNNLVGFIDPDATAAQDAYGDYLESQQ